MSHTTIEQALDQQGLCLFQTVGDSMEPILHSRFSTVVIEKVNGPLQRNDVVLFHRPPGVIKSQPNGAYVLHRIVKVREQDYLICGDNRLFREPVPERWILGVMTGFWNGDTFVDCKTDAGYRRYVEKLKYGYPLRWLRALPGRVLRKLRHIL